MRVTVVSPYLPHRRVGHGGGVSIGHMVRHLGRLHSTVLVSLERPAESGLGPQTAADLGVDVLTLPFLDAGARGTDRLRLVADRLAAGGRGLLHGHPYYLSKYWSSDLSRALCDRVTATRPDVVLVEGMQMILFLRDLRYRRDAGGLEAALVLGSDELSSLPRLRRLETERNPLKRMALKHETDAWRRVQAQATHWADATFCVTDQDRDLLRADGGRACHTVPLGIDIDRISTDRAPVDPPRLLFVGSFSHAPNRTAAEFLVDKIWPGIANYRQDMEMILAGRGSRGFLRAHGRGDSSIKALGFVEDLTDLYRRCRLFIAPLTEGGGIKIKILDAMARGIPVVTTPLGAEGIARDDEHALWISRSDADFADTVRAALDDETEAAACAARARTIIEARFGWPAIAARMTELFSNLGRR